MNRRVQKLSGEQEVTVLKWLMKLCYAFPLVVLSFQAPSSFAGNVGRLPEIAKVFEASVCWQSSAFNSFGSQLVPVVHKKWRFDSRISISGGLVELTNSSLETDINGKPQWVSKTLDFSRGMSIEDLTNFPFRGEFFYTRLPGNKIVAEVNVGFALRVVFFPSPCVTKAGPIFRKEIGIGATPFGLLKPALPFPRHAKQFYLHHGSAILVRLDESFPEIFKPALRIALRSWNRAIGKEIYRLSPRKEKVDSIDCLSSHSLCISWEGTEDLSWIGWGGITSMAFDPLSGQILGSTIVLSNVGASNLSDTPLDLRTSLDSPSLESIAAAHLKKEQFKNYRHPRPQMLVTHLLLHEIGHANGFKHDFSASTEGSPQDPASSVMEYLPFSVTHWMNHFGPRDLIRLAVVYRHGSHGLAALDCSDERESEAIDPNCSKNDFGDPVAWYTQLCEKGDKGVFTTVIEQLSGLPERSYISILQKFLANPAVGSAQSQEVTEFLCRQPDLSRIGETLKTDFGKRLGCEGVPLPHDKGKDSSL